MTLTREFVLKRKKEIIAFYKNELEGVGNISFQQVDADVNPNWWMPTIKTTRQKEVLRLLNESKFQSRPFWVPMNRLVMFKEDIYVTQKNNAESLYNTCLSIPCSTNITDEQLKGVVQKIKEAFS